MAEKKKKKLTLTVSSKPQNISHYSVGRKKTSVVIEKKTSRTRGDRRFYNRNDEANKSMSGPKNEAQTKSNASFSERGLKTNKNIDIRPIKIVQKCHFLQLKYR